MISLGMGIVKIHEGNPYQQPVCLGTALRVLNTAQVDLSGVCLKTGETPPVMASVRQTIQNWDASKD